jgi:hypothetical protein
MRFFEEPLYRGWTYPCSIADLEGRLGDLPTRDIEGLWAIGLVAATRKDCGSNARYLCGPRASIRIYSLDSSLSYRLPPHTKPHDVERGLSEELAFGMRVVHDGSRFIRQWSVEDLRHFILEHVLLHEVGHHAFYKRFGWRPPGASEQFAEDYARRFRRRG